MHRLVKPFAIITSLGWIVLWAIALLLMWRPSSEARINFIDFDALATIDAVGAARWIGTAVAALAIALAIPVLLAVLRPAPERVVAPALARDETQSLAPDHPDTALMHERLHDDELPVSLRRASGEPATVTTPVEPPLVAAERSDTASIEARLERHEAELRRLREQLLRQTAPSSNEAVLAERENGHALRERA